MILLLQLQGNRTFAVPKNYRRVPERLKSSTEGQSRANLRKNETLKF